GHVHNVEARRQHADVLQALELPNRSAIERDLVRQHNLGAVRPRHDLVRRRAIVNCAGAEDAQLVPAQITRVQRVAVKNDNVHAPADQYFATTLPVPTPSALEISRAFASMNPASLATAIN